ncbi:hypothetical protein N9F17_01700 [Salibacteraceae bacterium]|jgi:hypothetical protein|nr:hypothetical protein [Salibacteraceae bacterium]
MLITLYFKKSNYLVLAMKVPPKEEFSIREIRPRFNQDVNYTFIELKAMLDKELSQPGAPVVGSVDRDYASLKVPQKDEHYWSPQLSVTFETFDDVTHIRGFYGPKASVWTMLMFFYAIIGFATIFVSIKGLTHRMLNEDSTILWLVPILILGLLSIYAIGYFWKEKRLRPNCDYPQFL